MGTNAGWSVDSSGVSADLNADTKFSNFMKLSLKDKNKVLQLHKAGVSIADIAARYGVHRTTIAHLVGKQKNAR
jgi:hypothetical protein